MYSQAVWAPHRCARDASAQGGDGMQACGHPDVGLRLDVRMLALPTNDFYSSGFLNDDLESEFKRDF